MEKTCSRCKKSKDSSKFYKNSKNRDGLASHCKRCAADCGNATTARMRLRVLEALGGRCNRCDIDDLRVLEIDHINGGGSQHRKGQHGAGYGYYKRMLEDLSPFQLLCRNCNHLKRLERREHRRAFTLN